MQPWQQRVSDDKAELDAKRCKLAIFLSTAEYLALSNDAKTLLCQQSIAMLNYSNILAERLKLPKEA